MRGIYTEVFDPKNTNQNNNIEQFLRRTSRKKESKG
jgi:5,10-methylenetetrahydrofolate reductase